MTRTRPAPPDRASSTMRSSTVAVPAFIFGGLPRRVTFSTSVRAGPDIHSPCGNWMSPGSAGGPTNGTTETPGSAAAGFEVVRGVRRRLRRPPELRLRSLSGGTTPHQARPPRPRRAGGGGQLAPGGGWLRRRTGVGRAAVPFPPWRAGSVCCSRPWWRRRTRRGRPRWEIHAGKSARSAAKRKKTGLLTEVGMQDFLPKLGAPPSRHSPPWTHRVRVVDWSLTLTQGQPSMLRWQERADEPLE